MNHSLLRPIFAVASLLVTVLIFDGVASLARPTQASTQASTEAARLAPASTLALAATPHADRH